MAEGRPPIFIVVTMDALRGDRMGYAGYSRPTSPELDKLSEESLVFENAFSPGPSTWVTFPAVLSATRPLDHRDDDRSLGPDRPYAMSHFSAHGVATGFVHSHPLLSEGLGYARDVQFYRDVEPVNGGRDRSRSRRQVMLGKIGQRVHDRLRWMPLWKKVWKPIGLAVYRMVAKFLHRLHGTVGLASYARAEELTDEAINVLDEMLATGRPCFLWLHYVEPHGPYFPPPEFNDVSGKPYTEQQRQWVNRNYYKWTEKRDPDLSQVPVSLLSRLYDASIRYADREIGRLIAHLKDRGLWERTALVFSSDHGEEFGEHGRVLHGMRFQRVNLHVPLLLRAPGVEPGRIARPVSTIDICPTAAEHLGVPLHRQWRGRSLLRFTAEEEEETGPEPVICEGLAEGSPQVAITTPEFRLIYKGEDRWQLYRLEDKCEQHGVFDELKDAPQVRELMALLKYRLDEVEGLVSQQRQRPKVDQMTRDRLRALGYFH